jgi:hypothetical protein
VVPRVGEGCPEMAAKTTERRRLSARVAITSRHHPDDPELPALRAELATEGLAEHIKRVVDFWPPLTAAQRERLALLLNPGAGNG